MKRYSVCFNWQYLSETVDDILNDWRKKLPNCTFTVIKNVPKRWPTVEISALAVEDLWEAIAAYCRTGYVMSDISKDRITIKEI